MSNCAILEKVIELFYTVTDVDDITEDSEMIEDLEIGSMDILFLLNSLEAEFGIKIPEKEVRKMVTVGDMADTIERLLG